MNSVWMVKKSDGRYVGILYEDGKCWVLTLNGAQHYKTHFGRDAALAHGHRFASPQECLDAWKEVYERTKEKDCTFKEA